MLRPVQEKKLMEKHGYVWRAVASVFEKPEPLQFCRAIPAAERYVKTVHLVLSTHAADHNGIVFL